MSNTIYLYGQNWKELATAAAGSGTEGSGICYDGFFFWIVDRTTSGTLEQYYYKPSTKTFHLVYSIEFESQITLAAGETIQEFYGITTDGYNFYIGYEVVYSDGGAPPVSTNYTRICHVDKKGHVLKSNMWQLISLAYGGWIDLTFDGVFVIGYSLAAKTFSKLYVSNNTNNSRAIGGVTNLEQTSIAFNGKDYAGSRNSALGQARFFDFEAHQLSPNVSLGYTASGMDFINKDKILTTFPKQTSGVNFCVLSR